MIDVYALAGNLGTGMVPGVKVMTHGVGEWIWGMDLLKVFEFQ